MEKAETINKPIEVTIHDRKYVVERISISMLRKFDNIDKELKEGKLGNIEALSKQISALLNESEETFENDDVRELTKAVRQVIEVTTKGEGDNPNS